MLSFGHLNVIRLWLSPASEIVEAGAAAGVAALRPTLRSDGLEPRQQGLKSHEASG